MYNRNDGISLSGLQVDDSDDVRHGFALLVLFHIVHDSDDDILLAFLTFDSPLDVLASMRLVARTT